MLYIGNTKYRVYSGENKVSIKSPKKLDEIQYYDYLQGDGVAYIDTGYIPNVNTKIETKFLSFIVSPVAIYSSIEKGKYIGDFRLFWYSPNLAAASGGERSLTNHSIIANNIYTTVHSNNSLTINGNYFNTGAGNNFSDTLLLMADRFSSAYYFNGRFYYCRVWENDVLVRDFVPCQYKGQYGMWDKVENKFYGNANSSGAFTVGSEIQYYDYLQTASGAYIDTDFKPNQDTRVIAEILLLNRNLTAVFGTRNNSAWPYNAFVLWNSPCLYYQYGYVTYSTYKLSDAIVNEHITIDLNKNVGTVNNNNPVTCNTATFQTNYPFLIGNIHTASDIDPRPTPMKVYSFKMYDNGTLVRDYKPCLYNNQAGLWDSVECKFYGNANNTGVLTVGSNS